MSGDRSYIWMYYGSPGGKAASSNQVDDATVVASFDFAEANGPPRDGTAYASNPTASSAHAAAPGIADRALGFDPQSSVTLPATAAFDFDASKGTTFSAWVRVDAASAAGLVYSQSGPDGRLEVSAGPAEVAATLGPEGRERASVLRSPTAGTTSASRPAIIWRFMFDGKEIQSVPAPRAHLNQGPVLGAAGTLHSFSGALDGVRIANVARPTREVSLAA